MLVSELLVMDRTKAEMEIVFDFLRSVFEGAQQIKPSEAIAVLVILSEPLKKVFEHRRFVIPFPSKGELAPTISARILGSRKYLGAPYLSGIVSGTVDADKLDYMARDSYFTGLPIGLDVNRLISKLEIIAITPDNVTDMELRNRAEAAINKTIYQLGISLSGLTAYEQMIVGRVLLYDRVYYHHKVRCGEAMARRLFQVAEEERGRSFSIPELYSNVTDERWRMLFVPNRILQRRLIKKYFKIGRHFVGEWHTHPEPNPTPSGLDLKSMSEAFLKSQHELNYFIMAIIGNKPDVLNIWVSAHNGLSHYRLNEVLSHVS